MGTLTFKTWLEEDAAKLLNQQVVAAGKKAIQNKNNKTPKVDMEKAVDAAAGKIAPNADPKVVAQIATASQKLRSDLGEDQ